MNERQSKPPPGRRVPSRVTPEELAQKSRGLGDTIEQITRKVGMKPCGGCKKRRDWLNRKVPYRK